MHILFAFLMNDDLHNFIRKLNIEHYKERNVLDINTLMLPHISVKQAFESENLEIVSDYFDFYFKNLPQFSLEFEKFELVYDQEYLYQKKIIWLKVKENKQLREIHNQINRDLSALDIKMGYYDGDDFSFHASVFLGPGNIHDFKNMIDKLNKLNFSKMLKVEKAVMLICPFDTLDLKKIVVYRLATLPEL